MKAVEYTTIEIKLPAEAVKLLDEFVELLGESADWNRQEAIEIAVMRYLYEVRNRNSKELRKTEPAKTFKKNVVHFYDEWQNADDEGDDEDQEAA